MKKNIFPAFIWWGRCFLVALFVAGFVSNGQILADQFLSIKSSEKKDSKISSLIISTISKMRSIGMTKENTAELRASSFSNPLVKVDDTGNIQTYIYVQDASKENISQLESIGVNIEIVNTKYNIIQAWIPFDKIEEVANLGFVKKITPPSYGKLRTGSVNSEGDSLIHSDKVRSMLGFDGSGVRVGVISNGIDHIADSQKTGDLPDNITIGDAGSGDEGTALLEIIHDIAPGAELGFSSGPSAEPDTCPSSVEFINSIGFLKDKFKAKVIVDDCGFLNEPFFEDGMVAQEAENAVLDGVVFVSAAGNDADEHYQAHYVEAPPGKQPSGFTSAHFHDFGASAGGASNIFMPVSVCGTQFSSNCPGAPNNFITVVLQWNDPFGQSSNDYDLYLFDDQGKNLIAKSDDVQPTDSQNPIEGFTVVNNNPNKVTVNVAINRFSGSSDKILEIHFNGVITVEDFNVPSDSVFGHPAAKDVIAVGAVPATNDFCQGGASNPNEIEDYSSLGPSTIFFPSFEQRLKPDVVAPDDIHITGAGDFGRRDERGGFILCGTSGSAPHVAGVAALILSKNRSLTPDQVRSALENTAVDLGSSGADDIFGFGLVDAFAAVQSVSVEATPVPTSAPSRGSGGGGGCALVGRAAVGQGSTNLLIFLLPVAVLGLKRLRVFVKSKGR